MKEIFDYIARYPFKNFFALILVPLMLYLMIYDGTLKDLLIVLVTLIIKHFYDSNTSNVQKDKTISDALKSQGNTPTVPITTDKTEVNITQKT